MKALITITFVLVQLCVWTQENNYHPNFDLLYIQNPQQDYLILNEENRLEISASGLPYFDIELRADSCQISYKNNIVIVTPHSLTDSIINLDLYYKKTGEFLYSRSFVLTKINQPIEVSKVQKDSVWTKCSIEKVPVNLTINKINNLFIPDWQNIKTQFYFDINNAKFIKYENGVLLVKPYINKPVKITIKEKGTNNVLFMRTFNVIKY